MRIFFLGDHESKMDFFGGRSDLIHTSPENINPGSDDILFDMRDEAWDVELYSKFSNTVFLNAVIGTLAEHRAPEHIVRINGWPGMLTRPRVEGSAIKSVQEKANSILKKLDKDVDWVADVPGMVSPRVIAMIINEACFAEKEGVSNRSSIDTAMRLGTNYPNGPFEWADIIGLEKIFRLLEKLSLTDSRYEPADLLKQLP